MTCTECIKKAFELIVSNIPPSYWNIPLLSVMGPHFLLSISCVAHFNTS